MAQRNGKTTGGVTGKGFMPGQSGNPGGRPKGLVRRIREETQDGEELVTYMLDVFRDESETTRTRVEAATWLTDRGFGKPTQTTALELSGLSDESAEPPEHEGFTFEDLRRMIAGDVSQAPPVEPNEAASA